MPTVKDIRRLVTQPDELFIINENDTAAIAAKKMSENGIGGILVFDQDNKFTGVLTERDMLAKVLANSLAPEQVSVKEIMTLDPIFCNMESTIDEVEELMAENSIRHLPVVKNDIPIGMISSRDVMSYRLLNNKAMRAAAEEVAMISAGLKSLNLDDVISLAIEEVPKSFSAGCAALCFAQENFSDPMIYRKDCLLSKEKLLDIDNIYKLADDEKVVSVQACDACAKCGDHTKRVLIPLMMHDQFNKTDDLNAGRYGFLCLGRLSEFSMDSEESRIYKGELVQEVLNINLTNANLYQNYRKAQRDSEVDPLTGVGTRRVLERVLRAEHARAIRYDSSFSLAMIDIDDFKDINDTAGHAAGDRALRHMVKTIRTHIRASDMLARYGGDEFVLLMPQTPIEEATGLVERLRRQIKDISIPNVDSLTVSCGVTQWLGTKNDSVDDILKRADTALYEAKENGRNRVISSEPVPETA